MSIADKIQRLQAAKTAIATAITGKGGTVNPGDGYEDFADDIATIPAGGGALDMRKGYKFAYSTFNIMPDELANANWETVKNASYMFHNSAITQIPARELTQAVNISYMFRNCSGITSVAFTFPAKLTNVEYAFASCSQLVSLPELDTSGVTNFNSMLSGCTKLKVVDLDTSNGTQFASFIYGDTALESVKVNFSKATGTALNNFLGTTNMPNLTEFLLTGSINISANINRCPNLTFASIKSILTAAAATTNTNAKTLTLNNTIADQNGELAALKVQCQSKGWTINGLTIQ